MEFHEKLIETFSYNKFNIEGIYELEVKSKDKGFEKTSPYPGFIFPISGSAKYKFEGTPYIAKEGNIIHGGANMDLDKEVLGNENWRFMVVLYDMFEKSGELNLSDLHFEMNIGRNPKVLNNLIKLSNISKNDPMYIFKRENVFRNILEEIFTSQNSRNISHTEKLYNHVADYMKNNYSEDLSVKDLANMNNVTENQLFYAFSKYADLGPGEYLLRHRLNKASELLIHTEFNIKEIAEMVGYEDPLYFSRIFKKTYGLSPNYYRKEFKNNPY